MTGFIEYIETSCAGLKDSQSVYRYKKKLLDEMTEKSKEYVYSGLKDEKVINDLIADEFCNLEANYPKYEKKRRRAEFLKVFLPVFGVASFVLIFFAYFSVSALTHAWDKTWLIIVGGVFSLIIFYSTFAVAKLCTMRRIFHPIARVLIIGCTVLAAVFTFLFVLMMTPDEVVSWPIVPGGIIAALLADLIFAYVTKQKLRTISLFVYMPAISTMLYIILSAYGVISWSTGWPTVLLGLVADFVYILLVIIYNTKYFMYKQEVDE